MVKNTTGGKKAKSVARFVAPPTFRPAKEQGELYALVEKNMGNGILNVKCILYLTQVVYLIPIIIEN